jgi:hypothetical protein
MANSHEKSIEELEVQYDKEEHAVAVKLKEIRETRQCKLKVHKEAEEKWVVEEKCKVEEAKQVRNAEESQQAKEERAKKERVAQASLREGIHAVKAEKKRAAKSTKQINVQAWRQ